MVSFRFGPFALDAQTAELRKHGIKIRLHEHPFRILVMLLDQPGEAVSRGDLRKALWPNDTVVEFDHSINAAIRGNHEIYVLPFPAERDGKRFAVFPMPEDSGAEKGSVHVTFLLSFLDELRRKIPAGR